ncbi:MAG: T9SS type A sorting domain-containing protein [Bacteroidota bacterium]|nr:T9SS type A sorting domain-containing protein [Bacteroidota bacterium]
MIRLKSLSFVFVSLIFFISANTSFAALPTLYYVDFGGGHGYNYVPNALTVEVGDTIVFRGDFATYPLVSTSVPTGALPFGPINSGTTFTYVVDVPGNYAYQNKIYASLGMKGSFSGIRLPHGSLTNEGREFYLGLLYPTFNNVVQMQTAPYYKVYALITSYYANTVNVSYFDANGLEVFPTMLQVPARGTLQIQLVTSNMRMDSFPEIPLPRSYHITSKYPITVQCVSVGANSGGSYLALPVQALGKNYVVASYNDDAGNGALSGTSMGYPANIDVAGGLFMVIATEDNTSVKITPNSTTTGGHVGVHTGPGAKNKVVPFSAGLARGQCYLVRSSGKDASQDMSGSLVEASKPVVVLAGAEDATIGGVAGALLDARDFMIEEMTPVEVWDTTGYLSIPFIEGTPASLEGHGDNYRVYAFDTLPVKVQADVIGIGGGYTMNTSRLASPTPEKFDITAPVDIYSTNGRKFNVMQYDERTQPTNKPYCAPGMMTIVPHARWRKAYNFSVLIPPTDHGVVGDQFLDVIADSLQTIMVSANGGVEHTITTALANVGTVNVVSKNYPNIKGARYRIGSGPFYLHSDYPFAVYSYGMNEYWYFGDKVYEQFESESAAPAGMQLNTGATPSFVVFIDTLPNCAGWNICVRDTSKGDPGVRVVSLIDDSDGVYYDRIGAKYHNVTFDSSSTDLYRGELMPHWHSSQAYCFSIKITNRQASASAPIGIIDNNGNGIIVQLKRSAPEFSLKSSPIASPHPDSIFFPQQNVGSRICTTFVFKNTAAAGSTPIDFLSVKLRKGDPAFTIDSIRPALPYGVGAQDSFKVEVCYSSEDSLRHRDSLIVTTGCFDVTIFLDAHSETGLINADNLDFGSITVGTEICKTLLIHNAGLAPFTLTRSWILSDTVNFSVDSLSAALLPVTILPSKSTAIKLCFHPTVVGKDSARIDWSTNIDSIYADSYKHYSLLSGTATPVIVKSVHEPSAPSSFSIRPNPASGTSAICDFGEPLQSSSTLSLFDVLGREIIKEDIPAGLAEIELPLRTLTEGLYYVRLTSGHGVLTEKLQVVR